jgi:transcriptional regulator of acetoin/glycerol metabolism
VLCEGDQLTVADLPREILEQAGGTVPETPQAAPSIPEAGTEMTLGDQPTDLTGRLDSLEKAIILEALQKHRWNQTKVAAALGLKRSSLQYKMKKHGLTGEEAK